jgi:23S rRNA (adenine2503-C2)-methyltransferase
MDLLTQSPILSQSRADIEVRCEELGVSKIHARNVFRHLHKRCRSDISFPGLPNRLIDALTTQFHFKPFHIQLEQKSKYDGSVKFLIQLFDHSTIEMVLMPEAKRVTLCVSSQVGCAQACTFCHTGRMGLKRNLTVDEIVGQVWTANKWIQNHPEWLIENRLPHFQMVSNIVFMGMGEPLDNVANVAKSITILTDSYGAHIAKRRISVSTAGHIDGLEELLRYHPDVRLAISVHSPFSSERSKIMPINRRYPLDKLLEVLRELPVQQEHGVLIQYTLIRGVNDSEDHAQELLRITEGLNVKINLIPLNPIDPSRLSSPDWETVNRFRNKIYKSGVRVLVRYSKGQDISAACGQLVTTQSDLPTLN